MVNTNRLAAMQRIRALLAKTVANGCTESEALAAAAKAGELMDRYGLTYSDLELKSERCRMHCTDTKHHDVNRVCGAIARYCSCVVWFYSGSAEYYGFSVDVLIADYMTSLCRSAMDVEFERYFQSDARPRDKKKQSLRRTFMISMADRLSDRFDEMLSSREATAKTSDGTSLVVVKRDIVKDQLHALGLGFKPRKTPLFRDASSRHRNSTSAWEAGQAAGDRVNLVTGVPEAPARKPIR